MSDYIKREDAYSACCYETPECYMARKDIKALPCADVAPVRHGHWIKITPSGIYVCSKCEQCVMTCDIEAYKYCQWCGARMNGEDYE